MNNKNDRMDLNNSFRKTQKKINDKKRWTDDYKKVTSSYEDLEVLLEMFNEKQATEEELESQFNQTKIQLEALEFKNMLRNEEDKLGAIITINAGAGGTESCDWAQMLMRMYIRWGERNKCKVNIRESGRGEKVHESLISFEESQYTEILEDRYIIGNQMINTVPWSISTDTDTYSLSSKKEIEVFLNLTERQMGWTSRNL